VSTPNAQDSLRQPLYLASGARSLFGWLYRPVGETSGSLGLVICRPFGFEALCSHRSVRAFATALATAGVPVLCFDYAGTGDSEDLQPQADQLQAWTADVVAAVHELQRRTGVERVCLLGFRLGALLAARAAADCESVDALIAVAPVLSGARYLRELQITMLAQAVQRAAEPDMPLAAPPALAAPGAAAPAAGAGGDGSLEVNGYRLSAATTATLAQVDLMKLARAPVSELLVLDRSDVSIAGPWAQTMARLGAHSEYQVLPGFVEMMMTNSVYTVVPQAMIAAARDWLLRLQGAWQAKLAADGAIAGPRVHAAEAPPSMPLTLDADADGPGAELVEQAVLFGSEPALFGIVTEPRSGAARAGVIILLNDGANPHIGSNRLAVSLARLWARSGHAVLRMDLAGLGDSPTRAGCAANQVFPPTAFDDIRAAIALMRARHAGCDITLSGLCSGAYHAYRAAAEALPVQRLILVNQRDFFWRPDLNGNYLRFELAISAPGIYRSRARSAASWKKLLRGQVNVRHIAGIYARRTWLALGTRLRELGRALHLRLPRDLGWELERMVGRGVLPIFIYSRGDAGWRLLQMLAGSSLARLGARCRVRVIDGSDHTFTGSAARALLQRVLCEELAAGEAAPAAHGEVHTVAPKLPEPSRALSSSV
jgi:alpha-beta hydrolase superfamily lysophospholipase